MSKYKPEYWSAEARNTSKVNEQVVRQTRRESVRETGRSKHRIVGEIELWFSQL